MIDEAKIIGFLLQDTLNPIIFAPMEIDLEINSVNDYASSLMNIFNFDPMEAEKKARKGGKAE